MNREQKAQVIEELAEKFKANPFFYITDASGMTVAQINAFRKLCFERNIEYRVVKNKLIAKALEQQSADFSILNETALKGFSGILFEKETGNAPAKLLKEFRKKQNLDRPLLKAASIDSDLIIGEENLNMLSDLKSKNELIGEVIGLLQSPAKNVVSALQSGGHTIAGLVKALEERAA
jgi:large subunit ribosomal protein L10